jgi:hypothetical protein
MEGEMEQVHASVPPLHTIDLDSIIEALEELKLWTLEVRASGSSWPLSSDHKGLQCQLSTFLGPRSTQEDLRCVLFSLANIMA